MSGVVFRTMVLGLLRDRAALAMTFLLPAIFFVIFFVTALFRTYVDAAFIKRYGPQYIPYMLVINALLTFVIMGVIDRLARRFMDYHLLAGFLAGYHFEQH